MTETGPSTRSSDPRHRDELEWLRDTLGGEGDGPTQRYLVRPRRDAPQLLVPLEPLAAAASALRRYHDDRSLGQRAVGLAGQAVARVGGLQRLGGEVLELPTFALVKQLARALGEPHLIPAVSLGPRRRNRKPVLQLLRPDGVTVGFAKVGWSELTGGLVRNEAEWLRRVDGRLPAGLRSPVVLHEQSAGRADHTVDVVVTTALPTSVFSHRRGPLPVGLMAALARIESGGSRSVADLAMLQQWQVGPIAGLVDLSALGDRHGAEVVELGFWHGDLTPWNTATTCGISSVWDWEFADADRPLGFDALHVAFETVRRRSPGNERRAIEAVIVDGPAILASVPEARTGPGPVTAASADATLDLYFCELLAREVRLAGQGWRPEHLGRLDRHLIDVLGRRLGSSTGV